MLKFICEDCGYRFEIEKVKVAKCFNPDCFKCGSSDTTEINKIVKELTEYEFTQE